MRCAAEGLWVPIEQEFCATSPLCERLENRSADLPRSFKVDWTDESTPLELGNPSADQCSQYVHRRPTLLTFNFTCTTCIRVRL